jgi:diketogulonate reductase-like aldo/keto reductase
MPQRLLAKERVALKRTIPSSGELLPTIGLGTSRTFDAGDNQAARSQLAEVLQAFFDNGGVLIDSSPMYGSSESVIGGLLKTTKINNSLFSATKVWTDGKQSGIRQMKESMRLWGVDKFDLMQIHNLRDWKIHLGTLSEWKEQGKVRYIGITTSHGRSHTELEQVIKTESLDFVQFTYNIDNRIAEQRLLPLAADRGMATLINRPFQRGSLFGKVKGEPLPAWAAEFDCKSWGQYFLKFIASHPAVTCSIPATSKVHHMVDNMAAGFGRLPDSEMRNRMIRHFESL